MGKEIDIKVENIRRFFQKGQPFNHPIKDHPLYNCEEITKDIYIDMLCVIAQYENDDIENQKIFIQRIMAGIGDNMSISDHIKRAMQISIDKVEEFIKQCIDNNLQEIFLVDSLIISCANGIPNKKQVEFIAEIADVFTFSKEKIIFLSKVSLSILEQNSDMLHEASINYKGNDCEDFYEKINCYLQTFDNLKKVFINGIYTDSNELIDKLKSDCEIMFNDFDKLTIIGINITSPIEFSAVGNVILKKCKIENIKKYLTFCGVKKVKIENCHFTNCNSCALSFENDECVVEIYNSKFVNISNGDNSLASVIKSRCNFILFEGCIFEDCSNTNYILLTRAIISFGNYVIANNCSYINCKNGDTLFSNGDYNGTNNEIIGCVQEKKY